MRKKNSRFGLFFYFLISVPPAVVPKQRKNSVSSAVVVQAIHEHACAMTEAAAGSYREEILWASLGSGVSAAPA